MNPKNDILLLFVQTYQKGKRFNYWTSHVTTNEKGKNIPIWKCHVTLTKKDAYISNELQLQNHSLISLHKKKSLLRATSILVSSTMAYNTTASMDKLTCSDYADFDKRQGRFGQLNWLKIDSPFLDVKLRVFKKWWQQRVTKTYKWGGRFQPVYAIEESAGQCSRKLCQKRRLAGTPAADTSNVQRHGWATQTGSQGGWRKGPRKQKDLCDSATAQWRQARKSFFSRSVSCKEEWGWKFSTICLYKL